MAQVTSLELTLGPDMARFWVTYESTNMRIQSIRLENDYDFPVTVSATNVGSAEVLSYTAPAHFSGSFTLTNQQRFFYDQWSYTMGAA